MALTQKANLSVVQQRLPYGGSCLPLTMELARLARTVLQPTLAATPQTWTFEDRVLVMLAPSLRTDVEGFHAGTAQAMTDAFELHQVEHLDRTLLEQLLALLTRLSPTIASGNERASSGPTSPGSGSVRD